MVVFEKKSSVLRYLGKNGKDIRLLERMIKRGEIKFENGMYIILGSEEETTTKVDSISTKVDTIAEKVDNVADMQGFDSSAYVYIDNDEYINLQRAKKGVKLLDRGYRDIIEKLIQYKKKEEKEEILEQIKEMKQGVSREIDK